MATRHGAAQSQPKAEQVQGLMPPEQISMTAETLALVQALRETFHARDPQLVLREGRQIQAAQSFEQAINRFAERLGALAGTVSELASTEREYNRYTAKLQARDQSSHTNTIAALYDALRLELSQQVNLTTGFGRAYDEFLAWQGEFGKELAAPSQPSEDDLTRQDRYLKNVRGIAEVSAALEHHLHNFPTTINGLAHGINRMVHRLRYQYGLEEDFVPENKGFFFFEDVPAKADVPIYMNNLMLTAFLNETLKGIVEHLPLNEGAKDSTRQQKLFLVDRVRTFADIRLLSAIRSGQAYCSKMIQMVELLHQVYSNLDKGVRETGLSQMRTALEQADGTRVADNSYLALVRDKHEATTAGLQFNINEVIGSIRLLSKAAHPKDPTEFGDQSERGKRYLNVFSELDKFFTGLSQKPDSLTDEEVFSALEDFAKQYKELVDDEGGLAGTQLTKDKKEKNYCYRTTQVGYGSLKMERVASNPVDYNSIIGASWQEVRNKLSVLYDYSNRGVVYSKMTPRGRMNSSMLIVGPYGCGKNLFLRALTSDRQVVGISTTTERILSFWHSQSEANGRALFEESYRLRLKHNLPAAIGWDEFDAAFSGGEGYRSGTMERLQKAIQSVLDGDTVYEGVSLIALTNEPAKIPVPIYRRFGFVQIIEKLTPEERRALFDRFMGSLPLDSGFNRDFHWDAFEASTDFASGDVIGKVFDEIYRDFLRRLENKIGNDGMHHLNDRAKEVMGDTGSLTARQTRDLFLEVSDGDVTVDAFSARRALEYVTDQQDVKQAMNQQRLFYQDVKRMMAEAFMHST